MNNIKSLMSVVFLTGASRFTPPCFRNLNHFSNSWLFPQVNRFRPDSVPGIMIALMYSVARL